MSDEYRVKVGFDVDRDELDSAINKLQSDKLNVKIDFENLNELKKQLKSIKTAFKDAFKMDSSALGDINKLSKALKEFNQIGSSVKKQSGTSVLVTEYKELSNTMTKLQKQMSKGIGDDGISRTSKLISELKGRMDSLYSQMNLNSKSQIDLFNAKKMNKNMTEMNSGMNKIESTASSLSTKLNGINFNNVDSSKIDSLRRELEQIQDITRRDIDLNLDTGNVLNDLSRIKKELNNLESVESLSSSFKKIEESVKSAFGEGYVSNFKSELQSLESVVNGLDGSFDRAFSSAKSSLQGMQTTINKMSNSKNNLLSGVFGDASDFKSNFAQFKVMDLTGDAIASGIRTMVDGFKETIVETDKAMTDLMKVAPDSFSGTGKQLQSYLDDVTKVAKGTGQTSVDVINATAKALQSGFKNMDDSLKYSNLASIFANVGDMEQSTADTQLASILASYGGISNALQPVRNQVKGMSEDYSQLQNVVDQANYVGNNFAVTTADVGQALQLSSSSLSTMGVSMEENIGMVISMNEVLQDSAKTGTALKSIGSSLAGVTTSLKDGTVQSNKVAKAMQEIAGIKVWDEKTGQVKSMYDSMDELHGKWDELTDVERNALGATIAGKTQINSFNALMSNWQKAKQYVKEYNEGLTVGSAYAENERYLDSIAGKWNIIKENLKTIGQSFINSDGVKSVLDVFVSLTNVLSSDIGTKILEIGTALGALALVANNTSKIKGIFDWIDKGFHGSIGNIKSMGSSIKSVATSILGLAMAHPILATITATVLAGVVAWNAYHNAVDKNIAKTKENISNLQTEISSDKNKVNSLKDIASEYDNLSTKTNKNSKELERYKELTSEIADLFPELVKGYDTNGDPILALNGNAEAYCSTLDKVIEKKQRALDEEEDSLGDSYKKKLDNILKDFSEYQKNKEQVAKSNNQYQEKIEKKNYEQGLKLYQEYEDAKISINEQTLNSLQNSSRYKNSTESTKKDLQSLYSDVFDFASLYASQGESGIFKFINSTDKLKKALVDTSQVSDEVKESISKAQESYSNTGNISNFTNELVKQYDTMDKFDSSSLGSWFTSVEDYVSKTGDLEGANAQIEKMATLLSDMTGIDKSIWEDLFHVNVEPLDVATEKLGRFLKSYGTGLNNLGKGGLADKLESEFNSMMNAYDELYKMDIKEVDVETLINLTAESPTSIQELVDEIIQDGEVSQEEYELLLNVMAEIENEGEISDQTREWLKEEFDMTDEEISAKFTVEADIEGEVEVDEFLKKLEGFDSETKAEIRASVNNKEEAEKLVSLLKDIPEEKRSEVIADYRNALQEAKQLGVALEDLPIDKKMQYEMIFSGDEELGRVKSELEKIPKDVRSDVTTELQGENLERFYEMLLQVDGKQVSAFLQTDGAIESLADCKSVEEMLSLINNYTANANVEVNDNGAKKGIQATKSSLQTLDGTTANTVVHVDSEDEALQKTQGTLVELNGKNYIVTASVDTNDKGLLEIEGSLNNLPKEKTTKVNIETPKKNPLETLKSWFSGNKSSQTVSVTCKVTGQDTVNTLKTNIANLQNKSVSVNTNVVNAQAVSGLKTNIGALTNKTVTVSANTGNANGQISILKASINGIKNKQVQVSANSSKAINSISTVKRGMTNIKDKTVKILANSSNATTKISNVKNGLSDIKNKTVTISANGGSALRTISNIKNALANISSKSINIKATKTITTVNKTVNVPGVGTMSNTVKAMPSPTPVSATSTLSDGNDFMTFSDYNANLSNDNFNTFATTRAVSTTATKSTNMPINTKAVMDSLKYNIELFQELENRISIVNNKLKLLDSLSEHATGKEKISYLKQQNTLYAEQQKLQKEKISNLTKEQSILKKQLKGYGFDVNSDGNLTRYDETLQKMENQYANLEKAYEKAQKAEGSYTGKSESKKKSLSNTTEKAKKAMDNYADKLKTAKDLADEYVDITFNQIPNAQLEWQDLANSIQDNKDAIEELNYEMKKLQREQWQLQTEMNFLIVNRDVRELNSELELLEEKIRGLEGEERIQALQQQIELTKKLQKETQDQLEYEQKVANELGNMLKKYGFEVTDDNNISNYQQNMNKLKESLTDDEFEDVYKMVEEYFDLILDTIPDTEKEILSLGNSVGDLSDDIEEYYEDLEKEREEALEEQKEALKDQLDTTKDIESQITKIYEEELEEQVDALKKATDKKISLLEKEKQAYNDMRSEADYQDSIAKQQKAIDDINKQIELAKRDDSLAGQSRLKELMEKLAEEQEEFNKLTQDKIDETVNSAYDKEIDRLEEENEQVIEDLEETWSDSKIAEAVAKALGSGVFTSVTGEVSDLQDKLLEYAESSGDAFGVMADTVKNELVENLKIALDTMKNIDEINSELGLNNYGNIAIPKEIARVVTDGDFKSTITVNSNPTFNINSEGEVDYDKIQTMIEDANGQLIDDLSKY